MTQIKLQQFEGPLDLLLTLIEEQQLNITEIALAQVTEQFLAYVRQLEEVDPTAMADYLTIAAKLLVIKSKAILPTLEIETDDVEEPEEDLTEKLLVYKQFKEVAKQLKSLDARRQQSFTRTLVFSQRINFWPDPEVNPDTLHTAILKVLQALKELDNLPKAKVREAISIQERITHLQGHLSRQIETKLSDLLSTAKNKGDIIITFLALLELIKQRMFTVKQDDLFSDVTITQFTPSEADPIEPEPVVIIEEAPGQPEEEIKVAINRDSEDEEETEEDDDDEDEDEK